MISPTLADVARALATPGMTEAEAERLHGIDVLVDCPSGAPVRVGEGCARCPHGSLTPNAPTCPRRK